MSKSKKETANEKLRKSPINYFSDLFIILMVISWILTIIIMTGAAIYSTVVNGDTSIWPNVAELVSVPLTAGGAIWMVKCSVQHAIAYSKGGRAHQDFPRVNADGEEDGAEPEMETENEETTEEEG